MSDREQRVDTQFDPEIAKARRWLLASRIGLLPKSELAARVDALIQELDQPPPELLDLSLKQQCEPFGPFDFLRYRVTVAESKYVAGLVLESWDRWLENPAALGRAALAVSRLCSSESDKQDWIVVFTYIDVHCDDATTGYFKRDVMPDLSARLSSMAAGVV